MTNAPQVAAGIAAAIAVAVAILAPTARGRSRATVLTLLLAPALLLAVLAETEQLDPILDRPALLAVGVAGGLLGIAAGTWLLARRPALLPVLAVVALPFRVPIEAGGETFNLLVPLYAVIAAGSLAWALPKLRLSVLEDDERRAGPVAWALGAFIVLYSLQAIGSDDPDKAAETLVFFLVPFGLLFALLREVEWHRVIVRNCFVALVALAAAFVAVGFVEYATKEVLLNPKLIAANQFQSFFRVNSLFFDPNIYGRFLALVMLALGAWLLWTPRSRDAWLAVAALALLWAGLVLTFSQSSFTALLAGLAVLAALRWASWRVVGGLVAVAVAAVALVLLAPSAVGLEDRSLSRATSGRTDLVRGGVELWADRPVLGWGSGAFAEAYTREQDASQQRAASASHTIPITVAAEQGIPGFIAYLAIVVCAVLVLIRGARAGPVPAWGLAAFAALVVHTLLYAAFLEDPATWALLGALTGLKKP